MSSLKCLRRFKICQVPKNLPPVQDLIQRVCCFLLEEETYNNKVTCK